MKFKKQVKCVQSYVEDENQYWTEGHVYGAKHHRDGSWSIETNYGTVGKVGVCYLCSDFSDYFKVVTPKREVSR